MNIHFDGYLEDYIPISQLNLDLIYIWNCDFLTKGHALSAMFGSMGLVKSMQTRKVDCLQFATLINGHTTQIVWNYAPSFFMPDSPDLVHGLFLSVGQEPPNDLPLDNISLLTLLPSEADPINKQLTPQSKQNLKFMMDRLYPKLIHIVLWNVDFGDSIDDYVSISQLRSDLVYMWNCGFETNDLIWIALYDSMKQFESASVRTFQKFQFVIPINGHITRILINGTSDFLMPNSSDLVHGLILRLRTGDSWRFTIG